MKKKYKKIKLTQGKYAIVDADDYDELIKWKWHIKPSGGSSFYAVHSESIYTPKSKTTKWSRRCRQYNMHRIIMKVPPNKQIDHINGNGLDNRKANLRVCSKSENSRNKVRWSNKKSSIYKGVFQRSKNCWSAVIGFERNIYHLGYFNTEKKAALAYNKAAKQYHRKFARLNEIIL